MPTKRHPPTTADKPAQRMRFEVVIFIFLSFVWVFAEPDHKDCDHCPLAHPCGRQRTYVAGVGLSRARFVAGAGCEACPRRSDQSAYPSQARPNPTGTAASGANAGGTSTNAGDDRAPKPSRPAAQRDRMPARNVAMPNST